MYIFVFCTFLYKKMYLNALRRDVSCTHLDIETRPKTRHTELRRYSAPFLPSDQSNHQQQLRHQARDAGKGTSGATRGMDTRMEALLTYDGRKWLIKEMDGNGRFCNFEGWYQLCQVMVVECCLCRVLRFILRGTDFMEAARLEDLAISALWNAKKHRFNNCAFPSIPRNIFGRSLLWALPIPMIKVCAELTLTHFPIRATPLVLVKLAKLISSDPISRYQSCFSSMACDVHLFELYIDRSSIVGGAEFCHSPGTENNRGEVGECIRGQEQCLGMPKRMLPYRLLKSG